MSPGDGLDVDDDGEDDGDDDADDDDDGDGDDCDVADVADDAADGDDGDDAADVYGGDDCDLQVVEAAVMSAKASPVMEEVGEIISSSFFKFALTMSKMRKKYLFF